MPDELDRVELEVGAPAHGGHCVARHDGQVIFVRHALPGEHVVAEITEVHRGYARADVVEVRKPSPDRIEAPCPYARPNACGGCDLQHAKPQAQLGWKTEVLRDQLQRLARLDVSVPVESIGEAFGWRTRVRYHVDATGRPGLLKHRSHEVVPIERCIIAHKAIQELDVLRRTWPDRDTIDVVAPGYPTVEVFWQVHPKAGEALKRCVIDFLKPRRGERAWDLYGGAGLFSAALAEQGCEVTLVESAGESIKVARRDLAGRPVSFVESTVERARLTGPVDVVVLDPPRSGAGVKVVKMIDAADPRAVTYVACDPAALARDIRTFLDLGWRLEKLRAFDCFPQTHHLEAVALLARPM
jgi:tRNA/tmRNA/rRNA uracil-C5-methylase (TrmA/RlmC/RlmD family)